MALEMRTECERCRQGLGHEDVAYVCSLECTFCADCAEVLTMVCPNCAGELSRRPRRRASRTPMPTPPGVESAISLALDPGRASTATADRG